MNKYVMKQRKLPLDDRWDVIVVGGGSAGCASAIASAREGAKTLLIEATSALGGMGTLGLVPFFCGYHDREKIIARGIAECILNELKDNMTHLKKQMEQNPLYPPTIDPELLKRIYERLVLENGAEILFNTNITSVEVSEQGNIEAIIGANKQGLIAYSAEVYVDCTGDGDLAAWSGASFEKGDEDNNLQPGTLCFVISNIKEEALEKGPDIHFYDSKSPIHKAVHSEKYSDIIDLHSVYRKIGPGTFGFNAGHVYAVDNTNPFNISKALPRARKMAEQYKNAFTEFYPSAFKDSFLVSTGSLLGIRETRRIIGDYYLTANDYFNRRSFKDEICRNSFGIDVHETKAEAIAKTHKDIGIIKKEIQAQVSHLKEGESFGIPYRCLTPKELKNVLVAGRCISTDRIVNGSVRIMPCCLNTGEAAGIAAAMSVNNSGDIHSIDTNKLRDKLKKYGAYLPDMKDC